MTLVDRLDADVEANAQVKSKATRAEHEPASKPAPAAPSTIATGNTNGH